MVTYIEVFEVMCLTLVVLLGGLMFIGLGVFILYGFYTIGVPSVLPALHTFNITSFVPKENNEQRSN